MAQIIQYKDRLLDTSVYPVSVAAAIYVNTGKDEQVLNTLDTVLDTKVESVNVISDNDLGDVNDYTYLTTNSQDLTQEQRDIVIDNLGLKNVIDNINNYISNEKLNYNLKQDKLYHGPEGIGNIKTINGINILGSGNVNIKAYDDISFIGVDSDFDINSDNAISNKAVTKSVNELETAIKDVREDVNDVIEDVNNTLNTALTEIQNNLTTIINSLEWVRIEEEIS